MPRRIGFDALLPVIFQSPGPVFVKMCRDAQDHLFIMSYPDTVQQGLKLGGVPWRIDHNNTGVGYEVHAIGGDAVSFIVIVSGVNIEVAG